MSGDSAMDNVARRETTRAIAAKERGNALFKDRRFEAAAAQYSLALGLAPPVCELRTEIPDLAQVRAACLSNRAAAFLSLGWHAHAVLDASACLAEIAFVPKNPQLEKLRTKVHRRRARAYEALGFARRAALDHARAARKARSKLEDAPEGAASSADDGGSAVAAGEAVSPWNVREDWATFVEAYLSAADLGRLRRVNRSWKAGVESNDEAWREAEVSVHGAFERVAVAKRAHIAQSSAPVAVALGPPLEHVPRVVHALLGRPPPIVIDFGTGYTKAGFAGLPTPSCMVGNFTVRNRLQQEVQVVDMGGRIAVDGASLVQFLNAAVFEPLHVDPAYHPVVMVVSSHSQAAAACLQGEQNRGQTDLRRSEEESIQRVATTLRREFGVPAVKVVHSAEAAMHRAGLETGVIVDIGLGMTRACPVVNGKVVSAGIQAQFIGAANVTNLLLHELRSRPELLDAFSQMSGFEVMLCVKGMKEEQLTVASSTEEALSQRPCTTEMRALSAATGQKLYCRDAGYFGADAPAPTKGLHELVRRAAGFLEEGVSGGDSPAKMPERCDVAVIGGTAQIAGLTERLQVELRRAYGHETDMRVLPVVPEAGWSGGSLIAAEWAPVWREEAPLTRGAADAVRRKPAGERGYCPTWSSEAGDGDGDGGTYLRAARELLP